MWQTFIPAINEIIINWHLLHQCAHYLIGQAILAAPMGVVRLMDLLGDSHEVIRNEAILLLSGLTRSSADIQKIVAFEGAFERVLQILE